MSERSTRIADAPPVPQFTDAPVASHWRADIQALRALAVVSVIGFHFAPSLMRGGFAGVDIFFVVSGFVVGGALLRETRANGRVDLIRFYARRVRRILPAAVVVALTTLVAFALVSAPVTMLLFGPMPRTPTISRDASSSVLGVANLWFAVSERGYDVDNQQSPYLHFWSLGVEEQFYLVAPLLVMMFFGLVARRWLGYLAFAIMLVVSFELMWMGWSLVGDAPFFDPIARAWELGAGVMAAAVAGRAQSMRLRPAIRKAALVLAWGVLILVVTSPLRLGDWPSATTVIPVAAVCVIALLGDRAAGARIASLGPIQWLGDRSYSLYLWHWPILVLISAVTDWSWLAVAGVGVALTAALSEASYRCIESPARRISARSRTDAGRLIVAGAGVVCVALATIAATAAMAGGTVQSDFQAAPYRAVPAGDGDQGFAEVLPGNLRPRLEVVSSDVVSAVTDGCNALLDEGQVVPPDCSYGTSGPVVVLLGDSHALQWFDALRAQAEAGKFILVPVTASGCYPFAANKSAHFLECEQWRSAALAKVANLHPDLIVVSVRLNYEPVLADAAFDSQVVAGTDDLLDTLASVRGIWIADTPLQNEFPDQCASMHELDLATCKTLRVDALGTDLNEQVRGVVEAHGWRWADFNDYFCDEHSCGLVLGDVFMYRDDDHITATFSRELSPVVGKEVASALATPAN